MNLSTIKSKLNSRIKLDRIKRRTKRNPIISDFYEQLAEDTPEVDWYYNSFGESIRSEHPKTSFKNTSHNVAECSRFWDVDYYRLQGVKDLLRTNLCRNKFCDNCQNALSIQRMRKFSPVLDVLSKDFDLFHIVFTVPNVFGSQLKDTVDSMYDNFSYLVRLFDGRKKIKGYNFDFGFFGCVRSLEITRTGDLFHPHFHCIFVVKDGSRMLLNRRNVNDFSFDTTDLPKVHRKKVFGEPSRYFSDFEVLLQKVWYLRLNGIRCVKKNIDSLDRGYSVIIDKAKGNYKEIFKYATKGIFKDLDLLTGYPVFKNLHRTLYRRHIVQGYGKLNRLNFEDDLDLSADDPYLEVVKFLHELENPELTHEFFDDLQNNSANEGITFISRQTVSELFDADL